MARKFTALIAALALGGGIANAEDKKLDERPSTERGVNEENKGGAGTTESTSKPSERKGDQSNGNNDSTNKNDQTDNYPRDKDTTDKGRDKGLGADTRGTDTREKGGVTDTREGTSPGNPGTSGSMSPASPTSPPSDREKGETTGEMKSDTTKTSALDAQGVIAKLHGINQFEIRLGKLALKKAKNKSVRSYGAMMIKDHTRGEKELSQLARKLKLTITKPDGKTAADKEEDKTAMELEQRLKTARGGQFDVMYLTGMVTGHTEAIDLVTTSREKATDTQLRTFLDKLLPKLKHHRAAAQRALDKLKAAS